MYKIISDKSIIIGDKTLVFPCSISKDANEVPAIVEIDNLIIVNFYPYTSIEAKNLQEIDMERNVWAFNKKGDLLWTIQPPTIRPYKCNAYFSVYIKDGMVLAGNCGGFDYKVDIKNGDVTKYPDTPTRPW